MAQRRSRAKQAERVRRLPSGGRIPGGREVHQAEPHHYTGWLQRGPAGGRLHQPTTGLVWGRHCPSRVRTLIKTLNMLNKRL